MKQILLSCLSLLFVLLGFGQDKSITELPSGTYETSVKSNQIKWDRGDIILLDDQHYRISSSNEVGEYKFSIAAQRIFFTTGPLKSAFAKTIIKNNIPAIVLPAAENAAYGVQGEIWGLLRQ